MLERYWIWYQLSLGAGNRRTGEVLSYFGDAKKLYEAGEYEWALSGIFTPSQLMKLKKTDISLADKVIDECISLGIKAVTVSDKDYPRMLRGLDDLPAVLYYKGDIKLLLHKITIAVVGTRKANENSLSVAKCLSASLVRSGAAVVSGGALGVDTAAHTGALEAGGRTAAVLGCGINSDYLRVNKPLRDRIAEQGLLLSEYTPNEQGIGRNFPIRNRIISGLSHGTLVIEADEKSGSLITASLALEQGRDVFAVPGDALSKSFLGVNRLIRDGAKPVFSAWDVLSEYAYRYPKAINIDRIERELVLSDDVSSLPTKARIEKTQTDFRQEQFAAVKDVSVLSQEAKSVYAVLTENPIHIDEIIGKTALSLPKVFSAVTELELGDFIDSLPGKQYRLK